MLYDLMICTGKSTIIFDIGGTLIDGKKSSIKARFYALEKVYGDKIPAKISNRKLKESIGRSWDIVLKKCGIPACEIKALENYCIEGKQKFACLDKLAKGARKMLETFKAQGKTICLATSKHRLLTEMSLAQFGIAKYFDVIVCKDDENFNSKSEIIAAVVQKLGIPAENCLAFGNMSEDVQGASCNGITFVRSEQSNYGDILIQKVKNYIQNSINFVKNILTSPLKYKLDGFS